MKIGNNAKKKWEIENKVKKKIEKEIGNNEKKIKWKQTIMEKEKKVKQTMIQKKGNRQ